MSTTNMPSPTRHPGRGTVLALTRSDVVARAFSQIAAVPVPPRGAPNDAGKRPIHYRLEDNNGGKDPTAPHCADWSYGLRTPTADCIGFALWASGIDRLQPGYAGSRGEWLNCAALLDDADGAMRFCRRRMSGEAAKPGDWLLTQSHIGVIVRPAPSTQYEHLVVDCSPRNGRFHAIDTGGPWSGECVAVCPLFYAEP